MVPLGLSVTIRVSSSPASRSTRSIRSWLAAARRRLTWAKTPRHTGILLMRPCRETTVRNASLPDRAMSVLSRSKKAAGVVPLLSTDVPTVRQHRGTDQNPLRFA